MAPRHKGRNHSPQFKAKEALATIWEEKTLAELTQQFDVHPNRITARRKQLRDGTAGAFKTGAAQRGEDGGAKIKELHAKIRELTMEWDLLEQGLGRFDPKSGAR